MIRQKLLLILSVTLLGFSWSARAQACRGNPMDPPFNWVCGNGQPQEYCGSSDPYTKPSAITVTVKDENGGTAQPGDWLTLDVTIHDMPAGEWWEVFWLSCPAAHIVGLPAVVRMPCAGRPLTPDQKTQNLTSQQGRLFVMHWYGTYPCESPSTLSYRIQIDPAAQRGDQITLVHEAVALRTTALIKLRITSAFKVGDILQPITQLVERLE
ncbi:MAG: hypothetical protein U0514_02120 [Candidatus Andersenbacteria bacterium]